MIWVEIHQLLNSSILAFDWHFFNEKLNRRENFYSRVVFPNL